MTAPLISAEVKGDKELQERIDSVTPSLKTNLDRAIAELCIRLSIKVKRDKLSGQVLNVRTGRLRRSITYRVAQAGTLTVAGYVGTNVKYARRFEKGFTGTETVKEHLRKQTKAWGRPMDPPKEVTVRSFSRQVDVPAKSFLASALTEMRPEVRAGIDTAVKASIKR